MRMRLRFVKILKRLDCRKERSQVKTPYMFEYEGKEYNLRDSIELLALGICEDIVKEEQRTESIMRKCKMLDSLSNALLAIKN